MNNKENKFIKKANLVHNGVYDYRKVQYRNARSKVEIICKIHGSFFQTPDNHLRGRSCPKCSGKGWSKEDFVKESRKIHKNKYDYSNIIFKNKATKVEIVCKKHGSFYQLPSVHLGGSGCPKCVGRGKTFQERIKDARRVHGDKYEYLSIFSAVDSSGKSRTYFKVKCIKHNHIWDVSIDSHIQKKTGCNLCGEESSRLKQKSDFKELIERIKKIHPKYKIPIRQNFINQHRDITYYCPIHGKQKGRALNLINGQGCPVCGQEARNKFFRDDWNEVRKRIQKLHPDYFVYPEQPFLNHHTPIVFRCVHHGDKISNANTLLSKKSGCPGCGIKKRAESQKSNWINVIVQIEEINKKIKIRRNQKYTNTNSKIKYICFKHGEKAATPSKLLQGRGCPDCAKESRNNYSDTAWCKLCGERVPKLYWLEMKSDNEKWVKIGKTFQSIQNRWWELKKLGIKYKVLKVVEGTPEYICKLERRVHRYYEKYHYVPKIKFGGSLTECLRKK